MEASVISELQDSGFNSTNRGVFVFGLNEVVPRQTSTVAQHVHNICHFGGNRVLKIKLGQYILQL